MSAPQSDVQSHIIEDPRVAGERPWTAEDGEGVRPQRGRNCKPSSGETPHLRRALTLRVIRHRLAGSSPSGRPETRKRVTVMAVGEIVGCGRWIPAVRREVRFALWVCRGHGDSVG